MPIERAFLLLSEEALQARASLARQDCFKPLEYLAAGTVFNGVMREECKMKFGLTNAGVHGFWHALWGSYTAFHADQGFIVITAEEDMAAFVCEVEDKEAIKRFLRKGSESEADLQWRAVKLDTSWEDLKIVNE